MKPFLKITLGLSLLGGFLPELGYASPSCDRMAIIAQKYELDFMSQFLKKDGGEGKTCDTKDLFTPGMDAVTNATLTEYGCRSLGAIEERLKNLENEESLKIGFKKLIQDLQKNKSKASDKKLPVAQLAGFNFQKGLKLARDLETILYADGLIEHLSKASVSSRNQPENLQNQINQWCQKNNREEQDELRTLCSSRFEPNVDLVHALNQMLETKVSDKMIDQWKTSLAIKKKETGDDYSFREMSRDLKDKAFAIDENKLELTREELNALKSLPDIEEVKKSSFAMLERMKKETNAYEKIHSFKFHLEDLKKRQKIEIQSKVNLLYNLMLTYDSTLSELNETLSPCSVAKTEFESVSSCLEILNNHPFDGPSDKKAQQIDLKESINISLDYLNTFPQIEATCFDPETIKTAQNLEEIPKSCLAVFDKVDERLVNISLEMEALRKIKDRILSQNQDLYRVRNFIHAQLAQDPHCVEKGESLIQCQHGQIAQEAESLISQVANLMIVKAKEDGDQIEGIEDLCESSLPHISEICGLEEQEEGGPKGSVKPDHEKHQYLSSTNPKGRNHSRDAWVSALGSVAGATLGLLFQPRLQYPLGPAPMSFPYANPNGGGYNSAGWSGKVLGAATGQLGYGRYFG